MTEVTRGRYQITEAGLDALKGKVELSFSVGSDSSKKAWRLHGDEWFVSEQIAKERIQHLGYKIIAFKKGAPDILAAKEGKLVFFEIKKEDDQLSDDQKAVMASLRSLGFEVGFWRYRRSEKEFEEDQIER